MNIYPNPSLGTDYLFLSCYEMEASNMQLLKVVDTYGREVYRADLSNLEPMPWGHFIIECIVAIDISRWSAGTYFFIAVGDTGCRSSKQVLVHKP